MRGPLGGTRGTRELAVTNNDTWYWGKTVVECLQELRENATALPIHFVDYEVLPPFDGRAEDIFVWFICQNRIEKEQFRQRSLEAATVALTEMLKQKSFPESAISSLRTGVTSQQEIEEGGGRFYFFR